MSSELKTLAQALPEELARVRKILANYEAVGPSGRFGATAIRYDLAFADRAAAEGDVARMIEAVGRLRSWRD